jgi:pantoate--beta-alanine ligase
MQVVKTIAEVRAARAKMKTVAFVPTMGALHEGHLSLMRIGKPKAESLVVSIFVNPTQFGPKEDLAKYPRPLEADLQMCREVGVDLVFVPEVAEIYPPNEPKITIDLPELTTVLEGAHRPGHLAGVCQVVAKLFNIVQPTIALFGRKDFQQLLVLSSMVEALNFPIEIIGCPTLREPDGLAMSSRNRYLDADERKRALAISRSLAWAESRIQAGERHLPSLLSAMRDMLLEQNLDIDYVTAADPKNLAKLEQVTGPLVFLIAARVGGTRLIDNRLVEA